MKKATRKRIKAEEETNSPDPESLEGSSLDGGDGAEPDVAPMRTTSPTSTGVEPPPVLRSSATAPGAVAVRGLGGELAWPRLEETGGVPPPNRTPQPSSSDGDVVPLVVAEVVNEREREETLRRAILSSAVYAQEVRPANTVEAGEDGAAKTRRVEQRRRRWCWVLCLLVFGAITVAIAVAVGASVSIQSRTASTSDASPEPTIVYSTAVPSPLPSSSKRDVVSLLGDSIPFNSTATPSQTGYVSTALSRNGTVLAVADGDSVHVWDYREQGDRWVRRGPPIEHGNPRPTPDAAWGPLPVVALSSDGRFVAVGAPAFGNGTGLVQVLEANASFDGNDPSSINANPAWTVRGSHLTGNVSRGDGGADGFGHDLAISRDGSVLVVAASNADNWMVEGDRGYVEVWAWSVDQDDWKRVDHLPGLSSAPNLAVSVSGDGRVVAMGDPLDGTDPGVVALYECDLESSSGCAARGSTIVGTDYEDMAGTDVSISGDGAVVAIAAPGSYECDGRPYCGNVRVFEFYGTEPVWVQRGQMIVGDLFFGEHLRLSQDGSTVAASGVASAGSDDYSYYSEQAAITQLFRLDAQQSWESVLDEPINGTFLDMSYDASTLAVRSATDGSIQVLKLSWG